MIEITGSLLHTNIIENEIKNKYDLVVEYYMEEISGVEYCLEKGYAQNNENGTQVYFK